MHQKMWVILAALTRLAVASSYSISPGINCTYDGNSTYILTDWGTQRSTDPFICTHMRIDEGVTAIENGSFKGYTNLTAIHIPDSVTTIGSEAFSGTNLTSANIPNGVTVIDSWAFEKCIHLTSLSIPESVTNIGFWAFFRTSLTTIKIPDNVTKIPVGAFMDCTNLTSVRLPNNLTSIGFNAFRGCTSLTSINLQNVINYGKFAFDGTQIVMRELDFNELPKHSQEVIAFSECHDQFDSVSLERLKVAETVFAIPAGSKIYCYSIDTVQMIMQRNRFQEFEHPISREKFNAHQMKVFKKRIIIRDELDQQYHNFQQQIIDEIENDKDGKRNRVYL